MCVILKIETLEQWQATLIALERKGFIWNGSKSKPTGNFLFNHHKDYLRLWYSPTGYKTITYSTRFESISKTAPGAYPIKII